MQPSRVAHARVLPVLALALLIPSTILAQTQQELVRQGDALFAEARYREALAVYEKARAQAPGDVDILMRVAKSREGLWDPRSKEPANRKLLETAAGEYREVLGKDPDDQEALDRYVRVSMGLERIDETYAFLKDSAAKRPSDRRILAWLALFCGMDKRIEEQESWIRRWIAAAPDDPEAHCALGSLAWDRSYNSPGDKMDAILRRKVLGDGMSALDRAIALEPNYFEAMLFENLLLREQAKMEPDPSNKAALMAKADEWRTKAFEARKRPKTREMHPLIPVPPLPPPRKKA
jgi:tetratricopeptide (TPR) repeat protein